MAFTLDLVGFDTIGERLKTASEEVFKEVGGEIEATMKDMVLGAKRDAPRDFGRLANAIVYDKISDLKFNMVCNVSYAAYMEFGTKARYQPIPGIDASQFMGKTGVNGRGFFDAILDWVKRKGITGTFSVKTKRRIGSKIEQQIEDEQVAFQIYLSILRHGVHPQPFFFKQLEIERPNLLNRLQQIL